jgi:hypothetical protein
VKLPELTAKEQDVLSLVAAGYSNDHIASRLAVSPRTVETHTSRIFVKLGLEPNPDVHRRVLATLAHLGATPSPSLALGGLRAGTDDSEARRRHGTDQVGAARERAHGRRFGR